MLWRSFCLHGLGPLVPLEGNVIANQYEVLLIDHLYSEIKHFYPDGSGLFHGGHRAQGLTEWLEYENEIST